MSHAPRIKDSYELEQALPPCSLDEPVGGIWLPQNPMDVAYPPTPLIPPRNGINPLYPPYEFLPKNCQWIHVGRQFSPDRGDCFTKPLKTLWTGDSHVRYVMLHFIYRLWGHTDYYADNDSGVSRVASIGKERELRCLPVFQ